MTGFLEGTLFPSMFDIRRTTKSGFSILAADSAKPLLFITCHESKESPDIIIRDDSNAVIDAHGPYVAQAQLTSHGKDLRIFVGEGKDVHEWDWDVVRHFKERRDLFRSSVDSFRFDCTESAATPQSKPSKRRLMWTSCDKGFELADDATNTVLAKFLDKSTLGSAGMGKTLGRVECSQPCSRQLVLAALVSVMGICERKRRTMQQVSRAFAWQAGPGSGPLGNSG